jgi:hypothetical protein
MSTPLVLQRSHAGKTPEKLTEKRNIRKIKFIGYLIGEHIGITQHHLRLGYHRAFYPILGGIAAGSLDDSTEIVLRQTEFVGIETEFALLTAELIHEIDKPHEYFALMRCRRNSIRMITLHNIFVHAQH